MEKELTKELAIMQEKIRAIHKLCNCIPKVTNQQKDNIGYLVHQIIESPIYNSDLARSVQRYQIIANKELFINVPTN